MKELKIIAFAGLPLTGKSTLAKLLENELKICRIDIDEIRCLLFKQCSVDSEKEREQDRIQMRASWKSLFALTNSVIEAGMSVIATGTFSQEIHHQKIMGIADTHRVSLNVIFCHAPDEVIAKRIERRKHDKENPSNLKTMEGYNRVRARYKKIPVLDLLDIDTSQTINKCLVKIIDFVK